ncbi:MAG: nicotinate (nicotinamide) nucleotide adenylyltransferase [Ruthenibacterium sp.]
MEKLLLFGGTFDPPHNGHLCLLHAAIRAVQPDRVVVMPTGLPPHKAAGHTSGELRMRMCACFLPLFSPMVISDMELVREGKSYTVDTVRALQKLYAQARIYLPIGSDMLLYFRKWHAYEILLQAVTLVVHCRDADDLAPVEECAARLRAEGGEVLLVRGPIEEVSSTEVRALAAAGKDISRLVPKNVAQLVRQYRLYQTEAGEENSYDFRG